MNPFQPPRPGKNKCKHLKISNPGHPSLKGGETYLSIIQIITVVIFIKIFLKLTVIRYGGGVGILIFTENKNWYRTIQIVEGSDFRDLPPFFISFLIVSESLQNLSGSIYNLPYSLMFPPEKVGINHVINKIE